MNHLAGHDAEAGGIDTVDVRVGDDIGTALINPLGTFLFVVIQSLSPFRLCNPMDVAAQAPLSEIS